MQSEWHRLDEGRHDAASSSSSSSSSSMKRLSGFLAAQRFYYDVINPNPRERGSSLSRREQPPARLR